MDLGARLATATFGVDAAEARRQFEAAWAAADVELDDALYGIRPKR